MNQLNGNDAYWAKRLQRSRRNFQPTSCEQKRIPPKTIRSRRLVSRPIMDINRLWVVNVNDEPRKRTPIERINAIKEIVSRHSGIDWDEIAGPSRKRPLVRVRQAAIAAVRRHTPREFSFGMIARHFGRRDHSTIMHACKVVAEKPDYYADITEAIEAQL